MALTQPLAAPDVENRAVHMAAGAELGLGHKRPYFAIQQTPCSGRAMMASAGAKL
jgi:hypothetical protein